jgi:2-oxo-4-hydroxy-4-carboxy-5-ureidoimidazoline decarboxylase
MPLTIAAVNAMSQAQFVKTFGFVFEHTPAIALQAWHQRPFVNLDDLHQTLVQIVQLLPVDQQLVLIRAHPDLGSRLHMADASQQEQIGAGLAHLTEGEYEQFQALNCQYRERFQFPFIMAVKHQTKASILEALQRRLTHAADVEFQTAIGEISRIAYFRLQDCFATMQP